MFDSALVSDRVYEWLKERIMVGTLAPGQRIVLGDVSNEIGVSRTPILEALKRLAFDRLVVVSPRRGAFVRQFSPSELEENYQATYILLPAICESVAETASDTLIADLEQFYHEQLTLDASRVYQDHETTRRYLQLNAAMHMRIIDETHNSILKQIFSQLTMQDHLATLVFGSNFAGAQRRILEKQAIIDAMRARDGAAARAAMQRQVANARDDLVAFVREHPSNALTPVGGAPETDPPANGRFPQGRPKGKKTTARSSR